MSALPTPLSAPTVPAPAAGRARGAPATPCVLILDIHRLVGTALCTALRGAGFDAHELAAGDHDTVLAAATRYPDGVVLWGLGQPGAGRRGPRASELVAGLAAQGKRTLVVTDSLEHAATAGAIAAGAIGAVPKSASLGSLLRTLTSAVAGLPVMGDAERADWLARHHQHRRYTEQRAARLGRLTPREREVLELMATGHRAAAIAAHFVVALPTVRAQIHSILGKLGVGSQIEAVAVLFDTPPGRAG